MKKMFCIALLSVTVLLGVPSCKKGDKGEPGTANVIYSDWFTPSSYTLSTVFGIKNFDYNYAAPKVTQEVLDRGQVLVYGKLAGYNVAVWPAGQVGNLPIIITYMQGGTNQDTWSAYSTVGNIRINFVNNNNIYNTIATTHSFRYIIIPGGTAGRGINMDYSYENICRLYNIPQ